MDDMQKRIDRGDIQQERQDAIQVSDVSNNKMHLNVYTQAMVDIANDRATKILA